MRNWAAGERQGHGKRRQTPIRQKLCVNSSPTSQESAAAHLRRGADASTGGVREGTARAAVVACRGAACGSPTGSWQATSASAPQLREQRFAPWSWAEGETPSRPMARVISSLGAVERVFCEASGEDARGVVPECTGRFSRFPTYRAIEQYSASARRWAAEVRSPIGCDVSVAPSGRVVIRTTPGNEWLPDTASGGPKGRESRTIATCTRITCRRIDYRH